MQRLLSVDFLARDFLWQTDFAHWRMTETNYIGFFYNTIKTKQPKFFIAENVKGILSLGKGEAIKQIVSDLKEQDM